jgi:diguanylate cyclase (GGDEF)-like protein
MLGISTPNDKSNSAKSMEWLDGPFKTLTTLIAWASVTIGLAIFVICFTPSGGNGSKVSLYSNSLTIAESDGIHLPEIALRKLNTIGNTKRQSELQLGKVWTAAKLDHCRAGCTVQYLNIRARSSKFWLLTQDKLLPLVSRSNADGIFVSIPKGQDDTTIVSEIYPETLYPISIFQVPADQEFDNLKTSAKDRFGGLLFGSLFSLSIFCLVVSVLNKDHSFLVLAGWLITTCRIAAFNGPWDFYWLGFDLAPNAQILFLKISLAFHGILSVALFLLVMQENLKVYQSLILRISAATLSLMPLLVFVLDNKVFFVTFWIVVAISLVASQLVSIEVAIRTKVLHTILFNIAWLTIILGVIADILHASGYLILKNSVVNVQTGAVAAALIMSIAMADKMRRERLSRLAAQSTLVKIFKRFKSLYSNVPVGLGTFDSRFALVEHNALLSSMLGLPTNQDLKGKQLIELFPDSAEEFEAAFKPSTKRTFEFSATVKGERTWYRVNSRNDGNTFDCAFEVITARKLSEEKLEFLARHDALTGFKNRHEFDKALRALLADKPKLARTSVAHIDIKGFKLFNELFGHALGDEMLTQFAGRIESANKRGHEVFRLDGDDFYVIFANMDGPTVEFECSIIQDALSRRHYVVNQRAMALEVGIGIVHLSDGISANDVLASASDASDRAKQSSETKVIAVSRDSEALKDQIQERHLMASMKQRFPEERLFLNAQPIISLADPNGSLAYEVLVRLKGENGGVISPGQFIPAAEKNGLMSMVDRWVLNETLVWLELNKEHAKRVDFITVNLSGASLNDLRFAEDALSIVKEHRQLASKICFEVTESVALFDLKTTLRFVEQTKSFGCKLALDDFGAGYTSFKYLKDIPSDILKIDGSYVRGINKSVANHAIVKAVTDLTHEMGMKCVAEWIEDIPTIRTLQRLGMDYGQGFGMSRPMSMDDITVATSGFDAMTEPAAIDFYSNLLHLPHRRMSMQQEPTGSAQSAILLPTV